MIYKTKGIVLRQIKYSDSSLIVTIYTEIFGRQSFLLKGIRGKKKQMNPGLFQPLFLLDMEIYHTPRKQIQTIKACEISFPLVEIQTNIVKSTIAIFLAEMLYKTIREEEENVVLFEFLYSGIVRFEQQKSNYSGFHLLFLIQLTRFLGFFPENNYSSNNPYFDIEAGCFSSLLVSNQRNSIPDPYNKIFSEIIFFSQQVENMNNLLISNYDRSVILNIIIDFYRYHLEGFMRPKSLDVLKDLFHGV